MESLVGELGLVFGTFVVCLISGFVPIVNAELFLIAVSATSGPAAMVGVALAGTAGQMTAKSAMYLGGAGIAKLPLDRFQAAVAKYRERIERDWGHKPDALIFVSSSVGLPPLYVVSILAGTLHVRFYRFLIAGFLGRLLRFSLCISFPQLVKYLL